MNGEIPKRCVRCGSLYRRGEEVGCKIHTGHHFGMRASVWTCCHKLLESDAGCTEVAHKEDTSATDQMVKFVYMTNLAENTRTITPSMLPGGTGGPGYGKKRVVRADNEPKDGLIVHTLLSTDTLDGLCLKYDISKAELLKANRGLSAASFPAYRKILVPVGDAEVIMTDMLSPDQKRKLEEEKLRARFSRQFKVSSEEAAVYLGAQGYDYDLAVKDYKEDVAFESTVTNTQSNLIFSSRSTKFTPISPSSSTVASPQTAKKK